MNRALSVEGQGRFERHQPIRPDDPRTGRSTVMQPRMRANSARLVTLCEPGDVGELALIKSLLDGNGIPYVVHHEHMGALYPGVSMLCSRVMVAEGEQQRAEVLLSRLALQIREATEDPE